MSKSKTKNNIKNAQELKKYCVTETWELKPIDISVIIESADTESACELARYDFACSRDILLHPDIRDNIVVTFQVVEQLEQELELLDAKEVH